MLNELALFAGVGGGILASKMLGFRTVCAVEINAYCARRLLQRQNEGYLSPFPIWNDVCSFDGKPFRGIVDLVSGGFPCQDISSAGKKAGITGRKSGLWKQMLRITSECRPDFVFIENSPRLLQNGMGVVIRDLSILGYDAEWNVMGARDIGAPHKRDRLWILAYTDNGRKRAGSIYAKMETAQKSEEHKSDFWPTSTFQGVVNGISNRMDRIRATGNGQVPAVAKLAFMTLLRETANRHESAQQHH